MKIRDSLICIVFAAAAAAAAQPAAAGVVRAEAASAMEAPWDIVILDGRVMDPASGLDAVRNVGIRGGKIGIVTRERIKGHVELDAAGLVVAPGFIDLQQLTHSPEAQRAKVLDGVTAAFRMGTGVADIDEWYDALEGRSLVHYGAAIGHPSVRAGVLTGAAPPDSQPISDGPRRAATADEIAAIRAGVSHGLGRGALGVAVSPRFTPEATPWEILEMFRAAAGFPGAPVHALMRRTEPPHHWLETGELFLAALVSGVPLHVMQAHFYFSDASRFFEMVESARARGLDITTEAYPYTAGMGAIEVYDDWESWPEENFGRLAWAATGERLTRESFARYRAIGGMVIVEGSTEEELRAIITSPLTMIISLGELRDGVAHPRLAGSFSRVLGHYVRDEGDLALMDALRKMTLMPAQRLEARAAAMRNKGRIHPGADADITVFDLRTVADRATYSEPLRPSAGIRFVLVGGEIVVHEAQFVDGPLPGKPVRAIVP
jgi:N-acyl-D-aspartate/D-glutamate deacylase